MQGLKLLKRTGWTRYKSIKDVESVADHSWRLSLFCLLLKNQIDINIEKCL